ncbi:formylglycine-generating enzyme family protein [Thalassoroseus pseudoceratinae]|uniref:formylglycine-generating enzyme family protein n=1 Tax=Thalassoroseus pseudoceratinae TaxID=2713176 RepID=UPI00197CF10B|nr:formylglycine-generating enzyme family protein [Thalassoroseus pseudoceratinae]
MSGQSKPGRHRLITLLLSLLVAGICGPENNRISAADGPNESSKTLPDMKFVSVASGEYVRGFESSNQRERHFAIVHQYSNSQNFGNEKPSHRVKISKGFAIAATEVTVAQFRKFVEATNHKTDAEKNGGALGCFPDERDYVDRFHKSPEITWRTPGFEQSDEHPVVCVSWNDANAFCQWLSKEDGQKYRLPSEAEWEYACRAGKSTWYSWGEDPDLAYEHGNVADGALEAAQPKTTQYQRAVRLGADEGDGVVFTAKVGSYRPNPWGLFDMHGNVWEWCQDRWASDEYERYFDGVPRQKRKDVVVTDPVFLEKTEQHEFGDWRSIRGGGWTCAPAAVRCSIRTFAEAADATVYTGFRIVRELP